MNVFDIVIINSSGGSFIAIIVNSNVTMTARRTVTVQEPSAEFPRPLVQSSPEKTCSPELDTQLT